MKISLRSNVVLPGMGQEESLEIEKGKITLREFLEQLSMMSGRQNMKYVEPGAQEPSEDWEVLINDRGVQESGGMDTRPQ